MTGEPLRITGSTADGPSGVGRNRPQPLDAAETRAADLDLFRTQLGRLGGTIYQLGGLEATIEGRPMVPMSLLNQLRRELVARLDRGGGRPAGPDDRARAGLAAELLEPILAERAAPDDRRCTAPARAGRAGGSVSAHRPDRGGRGSRHHHDLRRLSGHQAIRRGRRGRPRAEVRRRSTWRPRASRSPARPTSSAIWPSKGPTASWSATRAA